LGGPRIIESQKSTLYLSRKKRIVFFSLLAKKGYVRQSLTGETDD
jgi:hypothetical protein